MIKDKKQTEPHVIFLNAMNEMRGGAALTELGQELQKVVQAVRESGRPGSLVYTVKIKPAAKGATNDLLLFNDAITTKLPQPERGSTVLFATDENALTRNDPRQPALAGLVDITVAPASADNVRDITERRANQS